MRLPDPRYVWPLVVIVLAIIWQGGALKPLATRLGLALTPIGAVIGAIWWRPGAGSAAAGGISIFVLNAFMIWCGIGAFMLAVGLTKSRAALVLAGAVGGIVGMFLGFVPAIMTVCIVTHDCL